MCQTRRYGRLTGILIACLASIGIGLALVFRFLNVSSMGLVQTGELLAMIGLLVMPGLCAWAIMNERRATASAAPSVSDATESPTQELPASAIEAIFDASLVEPAPVDEHLDVAVAHGPRQTVRTHPPRGRRSSEAPRPHVSK
jgi:hypothetical protein